MRAAAFLAPALFALAACNERPPIEPVEISLRVPGGPSEVLLGQGFRVQAVRVWDKRLVPDPWDDRALAPLAARVVGNSCREDERRVEEIRVWLCHAFEPGRVEVPALSFSAAPPGGGLARTVRSDPRPLRVRTTVDPAAPGAPEGPGDPLEEPRRWVPWALTGLALLGGAGLVASRRRKPLPPEPPQVVPAESASSRALRCLAALRGREDLLAVTAEAADVLRLFLADDVGVPATRRTTEELAASHLGGLPEPVRRGLTDVLTHCDRVKFAMHGPSHDETVRVLEAAESAIRAGARSATSIDGSAAS